MVLCRDVCRLMREKNDALAKLKANSKFKVVRHQPTSQSIKEEDSEEEVKENSR